MDVKAGAKVTIEITGLPTNEAAKKTLARVCRKDAGLLRQQRYTDRHRPSWQTWRRGGRMWHHQMFSAPGVDFTPGKKYSVPATLDVIRDLASVQRWVKVTTA